MDLLTIQHEDFTLYVECMKFNDIWNKAFHLRFNRRLFDDRHKIDTSDMKSYSFIDTTFEDLQKRTTKAE